MRRVALFRRREVWLPTIWGFLLLIAVAAGAGVAAMLHIYGFLAENDPAPAATALVIEGWLSPDELDQAAAAFRSRGYGRIITTGGPVEGPASLFEEKTYAELAADYLRRHGLKDARIDAVPAPPTYQNRTYHSAIAVRDWAARHGVALDAFDVLSAGVHARRSRMLYRIAFGADTDVGILAARPHEYDIHRWWGASVGAKAVMGETIGVAWTLCCFRPADDHTTGEAAHGAQIDARAGPATAQRRPH